MPMPALPEPVKVSPLIKFFRYSFLIAGIFYGSSRRSYLKRKEGRYREKQKILKAERDAKLAEEKKCASAKELADLEKLLIPPECSSPSEPTTHSVAFEDQTESSYYSENLNGSKFNSRLTEEPAPLITKDLIVRDIHSTKNPDVKKEKEDPPSFPEQKDVLVSEFSGDYYHREPLNKSNTKPASEERLESLPFESSSDYSSAKDEENVGTYTLDSNDLGPIKWDSEYFVKDFTRDVPAAASGFDDDFGKKDSKPE